MDTLNKTLNAKLIVLRKQNYFPKRSRWKSKWRGLNKSGLAGSNLVLVGREARVSAPKSIEFPHKISGQRFAPQTKKSVNFLKVRFWCRWQESNLQELAPKGF